MTPLEEFEARWNAVVLPAIGLPLIKPSNTHVDVDTLPDPWAGVIVNSQEFRNLTMGSQPWCEETGTFLVGTFIKSGKGFAGNDATARTVREAFMNWSSAPSGERLFVESVAGPLDIDPDAEGGWHQLALELRYQAWTQGAAP